ncbi:MAG: GNAT family N-acetyltransferase [Tissierellia bacterium]|nr:GNAT family N-acetyltransferase [Tissierellia bacterium]
MTEYHWLDLSSNECDQSHQLEYEILRKPWGLPPEKDEFFEEWILGAFEGNHMVGTSAARTIMKNGNTYFKILYFVVDESYRQQKIGEKMLQLLERKAEELGIDKIYMEVFSSAVYYFTHYGYVQKGCSYIPAFIPIDHLEIYKNIKKDKSL